MRFKAVFEMGMVYSVPTPLLTIRSVMLTPCSEAFSWIPFLQLMIMINKIVE